MSRKFHFVLAALLAGMLIFNFGKPARAQVGAHEPIADTYIDRNYPTTNYGDQIGLFLAASNQGTCIETTYLLFKFNVPDTTIGDASLYLDFAPGTGSELMDMELRSSSDTGWIETGVTWNTQPALDATVLAISPSVGEGGTVEFTGATFVTYLNDHPGITTLVVRADCPNVTTTPLGGTRGVYSRESEYVDAYIIMEDPTAVEIVGLNASMQPGVSATTLLLIAAAVALPTLAWAGSRLIRRCRGQ